MNRDQFDRSAVLVLTLAAPSLVVGLARYIPAGPANASASPDGDRPGPPPMLPRSDVGMVELDEKQRAVEGSLAPLAAIAPSPFRRDDIPEERLIEMSEPTIIDDTPVMPSMPDFRLTAVVSGRRTVAMINGKACTDGASLGDGWIVQRIDPDSQSVTIRHHLLGEATLMLRRR
ncbi:MAG TPA: hypothetical protein ENK11_05095 [Phycisphaerales bacterium]|nr:hypothetical protein [Phycisphaerales bacterium]